jgi:hypothetical protein
LFGILFLFKIQLRTSINAFTLTALTAGGRRDAEMATPTNDPVLPPSIDNATPAPDGKAISTPTHKLLSIPLKLKNINKHNFIKANRH